MNEWELCKLHQVYKLFFDWCTPIIVCTFAYLHIMYTYNSNNRLRELQVSIRRMRKNKNRISNTFIHHPDGLRPFLDTT